MRREKKVSNDVLCADRCKLYSGAVFRQALHALCWDIAESGGIPVIFSMMKVQSASFEHMSACFCVAERLQGLSACVIKKSQTILAISLLSFLQSISWTPTCCCVRMNIFLLFSLKNVVRFQGFIANA